ncbi:hypothetical protein ACLB2K_077028 [Fragaria x ananassa]
MVVFIYILSTIVQFHLVVANSLQSYTPTCSADEHSALLQFKQSFVINTSYYGAAYPKTLSWKSNRSCCSWDGVECDDETGHVIGLDLSARFLYGSIDSSSSLFRLVHLESLNLAYNDFNSSQIPPTIRNFPRLRYLNFSYSHFSGQVPFEVSHLSKLSSLDMSYNFGLFSNKGFLRSLARNLTGLEKLDLTFIDISSEVPNTLTNSSLLTSILLSGCGLFGEFPSRIFKLQSLKALDISINPALTGYFPEDFNGSCPDLISLKVSGTDFFINLPSLTESFHSLKELEVSVCNISEGPIPFSLGNLRDLIYLDLAYNKFNGSVPQSLFSLMNLHTLYLDHNNLSGTVEIIWNFEYLGLGECNIREFPEFLRSLDSLSWLDLSGNKLQGQVPKWLWNISTQTLRYMDLSHNFLSGFDQVPDVLPWVNMQSLYLPFNMLRGSPWIPSSSIKQYAISNNNLTGQVPPLICNLTSLEYLDLSNNKLSGILPQCLGNFSCNLIYLNLGNNSFHGNLPEAYTNGGQLRMVDISRNNFHGQLPRSLENCASLESLVLSHNNFTDTFPVWLGDLPELKILMMDHNRFYGVIAKPTKKNHHFPVLRIIDLSSNNFSGNIPEFIGKLGGIWSLNISSNNLTGSIPSSLSNLTRLESLDLSHNKLSGGIPRQLAKLDYWIQIFNVSHNNLTGPLPRGIHFTTFDSTSYLGNPGLCGDILPKKCGNSKGATDQLPPSTLEETNSGFGIELDWKFAAAGLGSGLLVGVVLADFVITRWNVWFLEIVAVLIRLTRRMRRPRMIGVACSSN